MSLDELIDRLRALQLHGMADSLECQRRAPEHESLTFEERMSLMIQSERTERANDVLRKRLKAATPPIRGACIEGINPTLPRGWNPSLLATVCEMGWVQKHLNVLITGPCGVGKSYVGSALAQAACRADLPVRCFKMQQLACQLTKAHVLQRRSEFLKQIAKAQVLLLDDITFAHLTDSLKRDLLEIFDDRYDRKSTIVTSQLNSSAWHSAFNDPTLADAILDRLVHNAYKLETDDGDSMRKLRGLEGRSLDPQASVRP
jgi:DNA replication protein DnaC